MSIVAIPGLIGPMLGPLAGGLIIGYLAWRMIFFLNIPIGIVGLVLVYLHLPDYRGAGVKPLDLLGLILFGSEIALLSYVLEIFGEHALRPAEVLGLLSLSLKLIFGYGLHAVKMKYPPLQLGLFRISTFAAAVSGSFVTRLGILSTFVFSRLKRNDGAVETRQKDIHLGSTRPGSDTLDIRVQGAMS